MLANAVFNALMALFLCPGLPGPQPAIRDPSPQDAGFTLTAEDMSHGGGGEITIILEWPTGAGPVDRIVIERSSSKTSGFRTVGEVTPDQGRFQDSDGILDGHSYFYRAKALRAVRPPLVSNTFGPIESRALWFKQGALFTCIMSLLVILVGLVFILLAKKGRSMYIRPIPGLKAVEEAIGRATEMGRPILYCSGVADLRCPGVLASARTPRAKTASALSGGIPGPSSSICSVTEARKFWSSS